MLGAFPSKKKKNLNYVPRFDHWMRGEPTDDLHGNVKNNVRRSNNYNSICYILMYTYDVVYVDLF